MGDGKRVAVTVGAKADVQSIQAAVKQFESQVDKLKDHLRGGIKLPLSDDEAREKLGLLQRRIQGVKQTVAQKALFDLDAEPALRDLRKLDTELEKFKKSAKEGAVLGVRGGGAGAGVGGIGMALGSLGIGAALGAEVRGAFGALQEKQSIQAMFLTGAQGDQKKASGLYNWAEKYSMKTPFNLTEVAGGAARLQAYGLEPTKWIQLAGDMAGAMGKRLDDAVEAIADMAMGEMERGKEFGIRSDMLIKLGAHAGPGGGIAGSTESDRAALLKALESLITTRYKGGTERLSQTIQGRTSNLQDSLWQVQVAVGEALVPTFEKLAPVITTTAEALKWIADSPAGSVLIPVATALGGIASVGGMAAFSLNQMLDLKNAWVTWRGGGAAGAAVSAEEALLAGGAASSAGGAGGAGILGTVGPPALMVGAIYATTLWAGKMEKWTENRQAAAEARQLGITDAQDIAQVQQRTEQILMQMGERRPGFWASRFTGAGGHYQTARNLAEQQALTEQAMEEGTLSPERIRKRLTGINKAAEKYGFDPINKVADEAPKQTDLQAEMAATLKRIEANARAAGSAQQLSQLQYGAVFGS